MSTAFDFSPAWSAEIRVLLGHLGALGFACDAEKHGADARLDWDLLLHTASRHGVLPLFVRRAGGHAAAWAPPAIVERARREARVIAQRNFIFAREMLRLVDCLRDDGVPAVAYKGVPLAVVAYGDVALRQFSDLDLLVRPEDIFRAKSMLEREGYRARFIHGIRPIAALSPTEMRSFLKHLFEFEMQRRDGLLVDLHWQLAPRHYPFRPDPEPMWDRLENVEIDGRSVPSFGREDLVLVLCLHGAKDCWKKLVWIIDLAGTITRSPNLDWDAIFRRAADARMELPLRLGLRLVHSLYGIEVPRPAEQRRQRRHVDALAQTVYAKLFAPEERRRSAITSLHLGLCRGVGDKFRYASRTLLVPRVAELSIVRLPGWAYPLYYGLRPLRLIASWMRRRVRNAPRSEDY